MTKIEQLRNNANNYYLKGNIKESLKLYKKLFANSHYIKKSTTKERLNDLHGIVNMYRYLGANDEALTYSKKIYEVDGSNFNSSLSLSTSYLFAKDYENALKYTLESIQYDNSRSSSFDVLAEVYMHLKDFSNASKAGIQSLALKEKEALEYSSFSIEDSKVKDFNDKNKEKNIISFSLFGSSPKYCENAVINAKTVSSIYPGWSCRFYCSTDVPEEIIDRLKQTDSQVIIKEHESDIKKMLFWRFLVMGDPLIDRYIVRDCDSLISNKEKIAVDEWILSKKKFHIIRDYFTHTDLILAGMFGGVGQLVPNIEEMIIEFSKEVHETRTHLDQKFLKQKIWPSIKNDVLIHDTYFHNEEARSIAFPKYDVIDPTHHIGKNEGAGQMNVKLADPKKFNHAKWSILNENKEIICTYSSSIINSSYNVEIPTNYAIKLQKKEYSIQSDLY